MSLHPLNREMLAVQLVVVAACSAVAYVLWRHGHDRLALTLGAVAGVTIAGLILTALDQTTERR